MHRIGQARLRAAARRRHGVVGPSMRSRRRQHDRGVTLVEFALMAPLVFLLLMGVIICGIFAMNYVQLTNAARDGVRAAAICGGSARGTGGPAGSNVTPLLPNGASCTDANLIAYIKSRFQAIDANTANLQVTLPTGGSGDHLSQCQYGKTVEIHADYDQPFYVPFVGRLMSNNGSGSSYTLRATAEATCET